MKKIVVSLALVGLASGAVAADIWTPGYVFDTAANTGVDVWYGPGNKVTTNGAFARGANVLNASGGAQIIEKGSVVLRDGRAVQLTATRLATAGALAASAARLASGPVGIVAVLALPALYDWITADNAVNIRVNPGRTGVEIKDPGVCSVSPCFEYSWSSAGSSSVWSRQRNEGCAALGLLRSAVDSINDWQMRILPDSSCRTAWRAKGSSDSFNDSSFALLATRSAAPLPEDWLPSSLDDIAPYLTARLPAQSYPKQIVDAGGEIDVSPVSITGPSPELQNPAPLVKTTQYPAPAPMVTESTQVGNPYGLANNTPTQTGSSTGSRSVSPGSSTTSGGPLPAGSSAPVPGPIKSPSTTTSISNYNPTTNITNTTTTTNVAPQTVTQTVTNTTNITNTTNTSTVTNTSNTTTTTTNNTTNTTTTTTDSTPIKPSDLAVPKPDAVPVEDPCIKNPDRLGCVKLGDAPAPEQLIKNTTAVQISPVTFSSVSACPAPITFLVIGTQHSFSYSPLCDRLAQLKFLFLAMAGMIAAWSLASLFKV